MVVRRRLCSPCAVRVCVGGDCYAQAIITLVVMGSYIGIVWSDGVVDDSVQVGVSNTPHALANTLARWHALAHKHKHKHKHNH